MKNIVFVTYLVILSLVGCTSGNLGSDPGNGQQMLIVENDLSNQRITAIAEDSAGYVWFGTFRGLNRYNGHDFHQFFCTDDPEDLPDNQIVDLFNDSQNRLWVATINGVCIYRNNHHFERVKVDENDKVRQIHLFESPDKKVYAHIKDRLTCYDESTKSFVTVMPSLSMHVGNVAECGFDRRNKLWVMGSDMICSYQPESFQLIDSIKLPKAMNTFYLDVENDQICMGGDKMLLAYDIRNNQFLPQPEHLKKSQLLSMANITQIHPYEDCYWLFNTSNLGLLAYNLTNGKVVREGDHEFPFEMPDFNINRFFSDSQNNLWVASFDQGFTVVNHSQRQFNGDKALHGMTDRSSIYMVDKDAQGNLWSASLFDGLFVYDALTKETYHFDNEALDKILGSRGGITLVKGTQDGNIWLGSLLGHKVWKCRYDNRQLRLISAYDMFLPQVMAEDASGVLWIGTSSNYLARYDAKFDRMDFVDIGTTPLGNTFISGMAPMDGRICLTAFDKPIMTVWYGDGEIRTELLPVEGFDQCIKRAVFIPTDLLYDSYGILWIGTVGNGLLRYDPDSHSVTRVEGMPCTDISAIEEDKQGNLWVSTQYGLARIDRKTGDIQRYYASDGIGGNQFYDRGSALLSDGTVVFGGTHGLTSFNPRALGNKRKIPLAFEDFKLHNEIVDPLASPEILPQELSKGCAVNLSHDQNGFSISYAALDYASHESPHYYYKLEGHDSYWIDARQNTEAYYSRLAPGNYKFRVKVGGGESVAEQEVSMDIHIGCNPWRSFWAFAAYALVALALVLIWLRHRRQVRQQQEKINQFMLTMESLKGKSDNPQSQKDDAGKEECVETAGDGSEQTSDPGESGGSSQKTETLSAYDTAFMQELHTLMEAELSNSELDINRLAKLMRISRTKLYYKIKALAGVNPGVFFKSYKLNRAAQLLKEGKYSISEIADMTGFSTPAHFSTSFKKQFGKTPSDYAK